MKPFNFAVTKLEGVRGLYDQHNREQALRTLQSTKKTYLASLFNGVNTFLNLFTKYGAVIAAVLSVSGFLGITMTPAGWVAVAGVMLIGGIVLAGYSIYDHLKQTAKLKKDILDFKEKDSKISSLIEQITVQESLNKTLQIHFDGLLNTAKELNLVLEPETPVLSPEIDTTINDNTPINPVEKNSFKRILKQIAYLISQFFTTLAHLLKLPELKQLIETKFPNIVSPIKKLIELILPIIKKIQEFSSILTFVAASFSGFFVGCASILGVSLAGQSFIQSLITLVGAFHPLGIAAVIATAILTSTSLILNKLFFQDPHDRLIQEIEKDNKIQRITLKEKQLLLDSMENKNSVLEEKIKNLTLKIDLKTKESEAERLRFATVENTERHEFETEESNERVALLSTFIKESIQIMKKPDATKPTLPKEKERAALRQYGTFRREIIEKDFPLAKITCPPTA